MKILIIKLSPIEGLNSSTLRALAVAKSFIEVGNKVDFLTLPLNELNTINKSVDLDKINIIRTSRNEIYNNLIKGSKDNKLKKLLLKPIRYIYHKLSIYNNTKQVVNTLKLDLLPNIHYDIVISISDPKTSHLAALKLFDLGLQYNHWFQYWGDPLAIDINNKTIFPKVLLKITELNLIENADKIFYASPITFEKQKAIFKCQADKMRFIPTPYLKEKVFEPTNNEIYTAGYFGAYKSTVRNIKPLYKAFAHNQDYKLYLVGDSDLKLPSINNIEVLPRQDISHLEAYVDLFIVLLNSSGTQIPGKTFHYAATNKPVLVILDGEQSSTIKEYFSKYKRYYFCENEENDILKTIQLIIDDIREFIPLSEFSYKQISYNLINQ